MGSRHSDHDDVDDKSPAPVWAAVSWILAGVGFAVLALGLTGIWEVPYFPGVAVGILILAVFFRFYNDIRFRQRQTTG